MPVVANDRDRASTAGFARRTTVPRLLLAGAVLAVLGACASTPTQTALLADARETYARVQADPAAATAAEQDLKKARQLLDLAERAAEDREVADVDHYAYLARQQALLAEQRGIRAAAEQRLAATAGERSRIQLEARERELERARQQTAAAQARAVGAQQQVVTATAAADRLRAEREAAAQRTAKLEADLAELEAERTARGLVLTLGNDVLFDVGRAELKSGASRSLDRLAQLMQEHPERRVLVEGFTDSTGPDEFNRELSQRRAAAVRAALLTRGVAPDRIDAMGHGEQYPVASNANAGGRQLNRRVEVVISDESGRVASR